MSGPVLDTRRCAAALAVALSLLAACRNDPSTPPGGSSSYGPVGSASLGGQPEASANADDGGDAGVDEAGCLDEETYEFDFDSNVGGSLAIAGIFRTPAAIEQNRTVVIEAVESEGAQVYAAQFQSPAPRDQFHYRIRGLAPGKWLVRAQVDQVGTPQVGEIGDLDGYYEGTEAAPIRDRASANVVELTDSCVGSVDFGIGVRF